MKLGEMVSLVRGNTYKSSLLSETDGPVLLGLGSIERGGGFKRGSWKRYSGYTDIKILLHPGDIYVSLKDLTQSCDLLGAVSRVPANLPVGRLTQDTVKLEFSNNVSEQERLYVYWSLRTPQYRAYCKAHGTGTTNMSLSRADFLAWELPPRSPVRDTLIALFELIDEKIELNNQLNGYLEELLFAKYDELFPAESEHDGTLSDIGTVVGGATPSKKRAEYYCENGIGWITPRDLSNSSDKFISQGAVDLTEEGYSSCSAKLLPAGSVLFSSRAPIGYVAIAAANVATNQGFKSIVPKEEFGTAFAYCFLVRHKKKIADMGAGTTFPEVSGSMMKSVPLSLPSEQLCSEFSAFAHPILEQQKSLELENRNLCLLRAALLPKLMSGEVDVSKVDLTQLNSHLADC